jgi:glycosyltransferase involved in cell wall biosynthesis
MQTSHTASTISIVVPVGGRHSDVAALHAEYRRGAAALGLPHEFIYVLDGPNPEIMRALTDMAARREPITVLQLTRTFGEATALTIGLERARGDVIVTLPAYPQIVGDEIPKLVQALDTADVVLGHRTPRAGGWLETKRRQAFHGLLSFVTGLRFRDLGCGARAFHRKVAEQIDLYGDQHRFFGVLASRLGYEVREVDVRQSPEDRFEGRYGPRAYARSLLDIFTVFFLARFTKKPLRFFGMLGVAVFLLGAVSLLWLVVEKLAFGQPLADRPALLLASLLIVLGVQLFALGLLGELIIFTHASQLKDYQVEQVVQAHQPQDRTARTAADSDQLAGMSDAVAVDSNKNL